MPLSEQDVQEGTMAQNAQSVVSKLEKEQQHFARVIQAFRNYGPHSHSANNRRRKDVYRLSRADKELLDKLGYTKRIEEVDAAIATNTNFILSIVQDPEIFGHDVEEEDVEEEYRNAETTTTTSHTEEPESISGGSALPVAHQHDSVSHTHSHSHPHSQGGHGLTRGHTHTHGSSKQSKPNEADMDKLRSTLKQFVRDWSLEGKEEREACYGPLKDALVNHFSDTPLEERHKLRVLVPGAGLGRLAYDVAKLGFSCQGNEFSHYMLLSSFFILNRTERIDQHSFYPYVHTFSNIENREGILRKVSIPDVLPSDLPREANFSLVAGDFEEIYGGEVDPDEPHAGLWDAILTCFFMDTAKNVINYMRIIHQILAPGGVWVNMGPLLWHWENNDTNDPSIELSLEEVKALAQEIGFELSNERKIDATYSSNTHSMIGYVYHCAFWTATKVPK